MYYLYFSPMRKIQYLLTVKVKYIDNPYPLISKEHPVFVTYLFELKGKNKIKGCEEESSFFIATSENKYAIKVNKQYKILLYKAKTPIRSDYLNMLKNLRRRDDNCYLLNQDYPIQYLFKLRK